MRRGGSIAAMDRNPRLRKGGADEMHSRVVLDRRYGLPPSPTRCANVDAASLPRRITIQPGRGRDAASTLAPCWDWEVFLSRGLRMERPKGSRAPSETMRIGWMKRSEPHRSERHPAHPSMLRKEQTHRIGCPSRIGSQQMRPQYTGRVIPVHPHLPFLHTTASRTPTSALLSTRIWNSRKDFKQVSCQRESD